MRTFVLDRSVCSSERVNGCKYLSSVCGFATEHAEVFFQRTFRMHYRRNIFRKSAGGSYSHTHTSQNRHDISSSDSVAWNAGGAC